jgi:hypothetical protein
MRFRGWICEGGESSFFRGFRADFCIRGWAGILWNCECLDTDSGLMFVQKNMTDETLSEEEKLSKIQEIMTEFSERVFAIEQERDEKLKEIMEGIDRRKIDEIMKKIRGNE